MDRNQLWARVLLEQRRNGYSIWRMLRGMRNRHILRLLASGVCLGAAVFSDDTWFRLLCVWAFGMFAGSMLRDVAWLRGAKRDWPFFCEMIDWAKVEAVAAEEDAGVEPLADRQV